MSDEEGGTGSGIEASAWIIAQSICPHISGLLSMIGSSWIIFEVSRDDKKRNMFYHRLLLSSSIIDVMTSFWYFLSTWAAPKGHIYGAAGNQQTCTAQGFFQQIGIAIPIYNMWLIVYFYCILKYNWSETKLRKKYEPWVHGTALTYALGTAFAALGLKLFNPSWIWCWLEPYPSNCEQSYQHGGETTCIRGDNAYIYQYAFFVIIPYVTIFTSIVMFTLTYRLVREQEKKTMKYSLRLAGSTMHESKTYVGETLTASELRTMKRSYMRKSKAVKETASMYLLFFFITWSPTFSALILKHTVKSESGQKLAQEINGLFIAFLLPLQGFFNVLIYLRPRYKKIKEKANKLRQSRSSGRFTIGARQCLNAMSATLRRPFENVDDNDQYLGTGKAGQSELSLNRRSTDWEECDDDDDDGGEEDDESIGNAKLEVEESEVVEKKALGTQDCWQENFGS